MKSLPYQSIQFQRNDGNQLALTLTARVRGAVGNVFDFVVAQDVLPKVLERHGLLPSAVSTSGNSDPWSVPGSPRTVHIANNSSAFEQVITYARPENFVSGVRNVTFPLRYLATSVTSEWWFESVGESTQLRWTYTFPAKNALAYAFLILYSRLRWASYMRVCIRNAQHHFAQIAPRSRFRSEALLSLGVAPTPNVVGKV